MVRTAVSLVSLFVSLLVVVPANAATTTPGRFPPGFLWGVATSGFQSEGHFPDSNWTRYARENEAYGDSVDFRHRYPQDLERASKLGVNVFRTSVEWARIEPRKGKYDWREIRYYDDLFRHIRANGMRPMITLNHWVHPGWVHDRGAWQNERTVRDWLEFVRFVVKRYGAEDVMWITFNEASQYIFHEVTDGGMPVSKVPVMSRHLIRAHRSAYDLIHRLQPGAMVSTNVAYGSIVNGLFDAAVFNEVTDKLDFIGVDYYYGANAENLTAINAATGAYWNVEAEPEGIYFVLKNYQKRLPKLPLYVVEAGMATENGKPRKDGYTRSQHLRDHLYWVQRAIADGVKVMGFNYWSLTDNYEWGSYRARFGLYTVDVKKDRELRRVPTDGVATYRSIIERRGVPAGYVPVKRPGWCSVEDPAATCFGRVPTPPAP
ncbi:glycoside hydrolase family 1 protein [Actinocorallia populi]|uniref:glycoside hydrolase family 1 protein n=1 Tax=Actinocorallia populi TaxID=2079200 RepID=UPI000D088A42|nr:family 1 glycosylhydrolase [Actinocorallia populi]